MGIITWIQFHVSRAEKANHEWDEWTNGTNFFDQLAMRVDWMRLVPKLMRMPSLRPDALR